MNVEHHIIKHFVRILSVGCLVLSGTAYAQPADGMDILKKMSMAADRLNYSGEFVYVKNGKISSLKIAHIQASADAGSQQKLMALDGSMREIIQQDDVVACVLPDQGMGLREKRQARQLFKLNVSDKVDSIAQHYTVRHIGRARVANRVCEQVMVTPGDTYRYGYNLCVDSENQLLLSSELINIDGSVLESYKFVSVEFGKVKAAEINSQTPPKSLTWMDDKPEKSGSKIPLSEGEKKWRVADSPAGFELEHYIKRISPVMQADITHLVLGDGLAQVSVFVSPADASANQEMRSLTMGGLNSYTRKVKDNMITVVGEVPGETVKLIAEHTEPY